MDLTQKVKNLGIYVRNTRMEKGIKTARELSKRSGIGTSYLSNIENGYINPKRGPVIPSDDVLEALARGLDVSVADLHAQLGRTDDEEDEEKVREALLIAENYWNLRGSKKAAVDALLFSDEDGNEYSMRDIARITGQDGSDDDDGTIGKRAK